jgi:putative oxidoreductase
MLDEKKHDLAILLLRLTAGGVMLTHGIPKLLKLFAEGPIQFADPIGIGVVASLILTVFAEAICAFAIVIGFKTKWVAIPSAITMFVAAFVVHFSDPFGKKEKAILYLMMYIVLFLTGSGKFSLDEKLKR